MNLFANLPAVLEEEHYTPLLESGAVCIERIVSLGQASPEGFWYDQEQSEWVALLTGAAKILFEGEEAPIEMTPGDCLNIPARKRHRVEWTTPDGPTVWLAVHYDAAADALPTD